MMPCLSAVDQSSSLRYHRSMHPIVARQPMVTIGFGSTLQNVQKFAYGLSCAPLFIMAHHTNLTIMTIIIIIIISIIIIQFIEKY